MLKEECDNSEDWHYEACKGCKIFIPEGTDGVEIDTCKIFGTNYPSLSDLYHDDGDLLCERFEKKE